MLASRHVTAYELVSPMVGARGVSGMENFGRGPVGRPLTLAERAELYRRLLELGETLQTISDKTGEPVSAIKRDLRLTGGEQVT